MLSKIKVAIQKEDTDMTLAIPAESKFNVTLRFLATGFRLQYLFRIPENTISEKKYLMRPYLRREKYCNIDVKYSTTGYP